MAKHPGGRPSKLKNINLEQVKILASFGLTDVQIAQALGVCENTIGNLKKNPKFLGAIKAGKAICDERVEVSMYQAACGYSHPEDKIFCNAKGQKTIVSTVKHYAPDTVAGMFWLCNRQREKWQHVNRVSIDPKGLESVSFKFSEAEPKKKSAKTEEPETKSPETNG